MSEHAGQPLTALDRIGLAFTAIDAARMYGFSTDAAMGAAAEHLADLDRNDLLTVASLLAALIAVDLKPASFADMDVWREAYGYLLARSEREP